MRKILNVVPLLIFCILLAYLFVLLNEDKNDLTSALIGKEIPVFELPSLKDPELVLKNKDLKDLPALINVWATWCVACAVEHPFLLELSNNKGVPIYGINYKDSRKKAIDYLKRKKDPFKFNIFDSSGDLGIDLGVYGAPETFLISQKGTIIDRHAGALNSEIWDQKFRIYFPED